jgi:hypothetical protein
LNIIGYDFDFRVENMEVNGWELCKENIQPLSGGRKVSILEQSLDASKNMTDYENEMDGQIRFVGA